MSSLKSSAINSLVLFSKHSSQAVGKPNTTNLIFDFQKDRIRKNSNRTVLIVIIVEVSFKAHAILL